RPKAGALQERRLVVELHAGVHRLVLDLPEADHEGVHAVGDRGDGGGDLPVHHHHVAGRVDAGGVGHGAAEEVHEVHEARLDLVAADVDAVGGEDAGEGRVVTHRLV